MITLLALVPWVLTIVILLTIMVIGNRNRYGGEQDMDEEHMEIVRVAVYDDKAYWVYDNVFYESDVVREPDFETARPIDTTEIPEKKMKELFAILDELQDDKD